MNEANKAIVRRLFEATNAHDLDALRHLYAPEFSLSGVSTTFDAFAAQFPAFFAAFPDATGNIDECIAEGDRVVARWTTTATHAGDYAGARATGKRVSWQGTNVYGVTGGRITEMWQSADILGLLQQIDALPARQAPKSGDRRPPAGEFRFQVRTPPKNGGSGSS